MVSPLIVVFPNKTSKTVLFIALHIISVKIKPETPTIPPKATSNNSLIANPEIAAASPEKLFNKEIAIGISAPPIAIVNKIPKRSAKTKDKTVTNKGILIKYAEIANPNINIKKTITIYK